MTNRTYDALRWVLQYLLPATATMYFALSQIWGFPYTEQILGTIAAISIFLGTVLGVSTAHYRAWGMDGRLVVDHSDPEKDVYRMEYNQPIESIPRRGYVTFKVDNVG